VPDLFEAAAIQAPVSVERKRASTKIAPSGQQSMARHLLPKDLPGALTRLDNDEIDALLAAVTEEAKRRGRLLLPTTTATVAKSRKVDRHDDNVGRVL